MEPIWTINPFVHPLRALALSIRRWTLREDINSSTADGDFDAGAIPPQLQRYEPGELLPWKGLTFRVGKVVGGPQACIILVPVGLTHGSKLQTLRQYRALAREQEQLDVQTVLAARRSERTALRRAPRRPS
jgi:hypothetical protein